MTGPRKPPADGGGIVVSGSSVQGSAFASGTNARAEVRSTRTWEELTDLRCALREAAARGDLDAGTLRAAEQRVADVEAESGRAVPRMHLISSLLAEVAASVADVRDAGEAAQRVIRSIQQGGGRS